MANLSPLHDSLMFLQEERQVVRARLAQPVVPLQKQCEAPQALRSQSKRFANAIKSGEDMHLKQSNQKATGKEETYLLLLEQLSSLLEGETNLIANLANAAALLYHTLEDVNWAGFYLYEQGELIVGPFQGQPACIHIALGKGVCGTAAQQRKTLRVASVHQFAGHIACDPASQAEIVIPLLKDDRLLGVLDIDSPHENRFDELDQRYLEAFARQVTAASWSSF